MNNIHQTDSLPRIHSSIVLSDNQSQDWQAYKKKIDCHANRNSRNHSCHSHQHPNTKIQADLENKLQELIIPNHSFEIDMRWTGIMAFGKQKNPIIKDISDNIIAGVRLGGMGVDIGSKLGDLLTDKLEL